MDKVVNALAALGVPGAIFAIVLSLAPVSGGAAIMWALAAIGPGGAIAGLGILLTVGWFSRGVADSSAEKIAIAVTKKVMKKEKLTKEQMVKRVKKYKISKNLKRRIIGYIYDIE